MVAIFSTKLTIKMIYVLVTILQPIFSISQQKKK
jgi:hypothetical protein